MNNSVARAKYDFVAIYPNAVMVTSGGLDIFARQWPCSGMRFDADIAVQFEYAANGDLVDIQWFDCSGVGALDISEPEGVNGEALAALSHDAQEWLKTQNEFPATSTTVPAPVR